ncbi:MAG TPA: hypothetical protein VKF14_16855 [Candidatus Dormibacteraeota bacterium]|nr:hypothetical protein [Candidatus Dormibacteraeota bacterium]
MGWSSSPEVVTPPGGHVYATLDDGELWTRLPGTFPRVESLAAILV